MFYLNPFPPRRLRFLAVLAGCLLACAFWQRGGTTPTAAAESPAFVEVDEKNRVKEYTLKAAFLYNFLKYTTWPEESFEKEDSPIVLGVVGKDPFGSVLDKVLEKKSVGKRAIVIRRFEKVADVKDVHALFLGELSTKDRATLYAALAETHVLTLGDSRGMASADGCVASFFLNDGKVRFEVSTKATSRAGLTISSQLLKLAEIVEKRK